MELTAYPGAPPQLVLIGLGLLAALLPARGISGY